MIQHIDVHAVLRESSAGGYTDLVTRPTGRVVRESIARVMDASGGGPYITRMDFTGVGCIDYSCADEIVAKLVRERPAVLVLAGLSDAHHDAIAPVLERHGLAALWQRPDGTLAPLGSAGMAAELLEWLVAERLAGRESGGTFTLLDS